MNNVKQLREKYKLTQLQMAEIMGCNQSSIAHHETGTKSPTIDKAWKFINWANGTHGDVLTLNDIYKAPEKETA